MIDQLISSVRTRMDKSYSVTKDDLSTIRSGRATPALVENIVVSAYEGTQRLKVKELTTVTAADAKTLVITPFDPSITADIAKGIMEANVGLTPHVDGEVIRISIPVLTQERRNEYIRLAKTKAEAGRIMIRQVRQDAMKQLSRAESGKEIDEDEKHVGEKKIQELTDEMIRNIDEYLKRKEEELTQV